MKEEIAPKSEAPLVWTKFVAETLLPTGQGKFRLRGYRHTVRFADFDCFLKELALLFLAFESINNILLSTFFIVQIDGGVTFTEPSAIISGPVEGQEEVRTDQS